MTASYIDAMLRICIITLLLLSGSVTSVFGMDHSGHGTHASSHDEVSDTAGDHATQEDVVSHDSCVADAIPVPSMPAHGACLGCCPESTGTSEAVSADRRVSGPLLTIAPQSLLSIPGSAVDRSDSSGIPIPPPQALTVLRL